MRLIYFSPIPWQSFTQRPHEFVRWFRKKYNQEVLWVNPYPTRLPRPSDWRRPGSVGTQANTPQWLRVLQPRALPIEPLPSGTSVNHFLFWSELLAAIKSFAKAGSSAIVIGKPSALALLALKSVEPTWSLYDAMDNFPAFYSGLSAGAMAKLECELIAHVDSVWASSSHTLGRIQTIGARPTLVRNACSASALSTIQKCFRKKFTLGYIGTVGHWFDWDRIFALADSDTNIDIHIIGPIYQHPPRALPTNITITTALPHEAAIEMLGGFSAGLIPFKDSALTAAVDPLKYYEFRAVGLPIISTRFGEMRYRCTEEGVYFFEDYPNIKQLLADCGRYKPTANLTQQFRKINDWANRFDTAFLENTTASNMRLN
jgi:hypothetical protein